MKAHDDLTNKISGILGVIIFNDEAKQSRRIKSSFSSFKIFV
jgi:hypothetical protein